MAYSKEDRDKIFKKVCTEIAKGKALRNVLKEKGMPSSQTFYKWIDPTDDDSDKIKEEKLLKSKQYARSCEERAWQIFEDLIDIADDQGGDVYTNDDGKEITNHNVINRSRLRVDTRKWILSKMMPKKFGDKLDLTSDGEKLPEKVDPVQIVFRNFDNDEQTDEPND